MEYLISILILFLIALFLEKKYHVHLYRSRKERIEILVLFFIIGVFWDTIAILRGHWVYPPAGTTGIFIGVMPIEDYLYIFVVPYFILTIYKIFDSKFRNKK